MKISDVIKTLKELKNSHGDKKVFIMEKYEVDEHGNKTYPECGSVKLLKIDSIDMSLSYPGEEVIIIKVI